MKLSYQVTVEDAYPYGYTVPVGKKISEFRPPKDGDQVLATSGTGTINWVGENRGRYPVLVLEDLPPKGIEWTSGDGDAWSYRKIFTKKDIYPDGYVVPRGRRESGFRPPRSGEESVSPSGGITSWTEDAPLDSPRVILEAAAPKKKRRWIVVVEEDPGAKTTSSYVGTAFCSPAQDVAGYIQSIKEVKVEDQK